MRLVKQSPEMTEQKLSGCEVHLRMTQIIRRAFHRDDRAEAKRMRGSSQDDADNTQGISPEMTEQKLSGCEVHLLRSQVTAYLVEG